MKFDPGDVCPYCGKGILEYVRPDNCCCHISPPCQACVDAPLVCDACDAVIEFEED